MRHARVRLNPALLVLACTLLLAAAAGGCGLGEVEERTGGAELRVTRDFGRERIGAVRAERLREDQTVMRLLRSRFDVETRYGGRFVQAIEGIEGGGPEGRNDWFYFVNGLEAGVGAGEYELSRGDVVQWDYRRWDAAMRVSAIVGAFPEPFRSGKGGKRFPVRVECAAAASKACAEVKRRLRALGVKATGAALGTGETEGVLRVVVGRWPRVRLVRAARALEAGPGESGVFARFRDGGRSLELLDARGRKVRSAPAGAGLVAALAPADEQVVWLVTGVDERGVARAARALDPADLRDAYAVAATPAATVRLPVGAGR